jgi:hypothetical protein
VFAGTDLREVVWFALDVFVQTRFVGVGELGETSVLVPTDDAISKVVTRVHYEDVLRHLRLLPDVLDGRYITEGLKYVYQAVVAHKKEMMRHVLAKDLQKYPGVYNMVARRAMVGALAAKAVMHYVYLGSPVPLTVWEAPPSSPSSGGSGSAGSAPSSPTSPNYSPTQVTGSVQAGAGADSAKRGRSSSDDLEGASKRSKLAEGEGEGGAV